MTLGWRTARAALACLALCAAQGVSGQANTLGVPLGDPDARKPWQETEVPPPAAPDYARLIPLRVGGASDFQFAVDPASIVVGSDRAVRYTIIATSPAGVRNVSFEALRCLPRERRVIAYLRPDGSWVAARPSEWRSFPPGSATYFGILHQDFLCPEGSPVSSVAEAISALRVGIHPRARGSMP